MSRIDEIEGAENLSELHERLSSLEHRVLDTESHADVAMEALEELRTATEELRVAEEEIRVQSDQLLESRAELEFERQRYRDLFDFAPDAYLVTSGEGMIQEANLAAGRLLRVTPERLRGKPIVVFVPEAQRRHFRSTLLDIAGGHAERRLRFQVLPRHGQLIHVDARVAALYEGRDVQLRWLIREPSQSVELARAARAVTETHHRVKNNLQVIAAMMDMRLLDDSQSYTRDDICRFSAAVRSLATMHDLLTQDTKGGSDGQSVSARAFMDRLLPLLVQSAGGTPITSHVAEVSLSARQATALALILNELVSNALKHGRKGVRIGLTVTNDHAELSVSDRGEGFPAGFDSVAAAHTGLELVTSLGRWDLAGEVAFTNNPEGGGIVTVRFPLAAAP